MSEETWVEALDKSVEHDENGCAIIGFEYVRAIVKKLEQENQKLRETIMLVTDMRDDARRELARYKVLYNTLNEILAKIGLDEDLHTESPAVMKAMEALLAIDAGTYSPLKTAPQTEEDK